MRKKWLFVAGLALVAVGGVEAQYSRVEKLSGSVFDRVGVCSGRLQETANEITLRTKRLTSLLSGANALYSKQYNQVLVEGDLFVGSRLKDIDELTGGSGRYYEAFPIVSTIYHELGHAEWDVFIEEEETDEDEKFYELVDDEIVPWIDDNETHVDDEWLAVQEWHGYFRGKVVGKLLEDWASLLLYNGFEAKTLDVNELMAAAAVRQGKIRPSDFGRLTSHPLPVSYAGKTDTPYLERVRGYDFTVTNGMIDGQVQVDTSGWTAARGFKDAWWQAIWEHTDFFYCLHDDMASLIRRIEGQLGPERLERLRVVQQATWDALPEEERTRILAEQNPEAAAEGDPQVGGAELYGVAGGR